MNNAKRKTVIAGNWKMNMTPGESVKFIGELRALLEGQNNCEVVVCVPDVDIAAVSGALSGSNIKLGAQNAHWALKGAYTGETSVNMLKEYNVEYVIIGHSERRQFFGEIDASVNKRLRTILDAGLKAIVCVGERHEEKKLGITREVVSLQTKVALRKIPAKQMGNVIIAYEPVWAIGAGKTPPAAVADQMNGMIRNLLAALYSEKIAQATTIQYGGSMNAENAADMLAKPNIDGGLIGGASLKAKDFAAIVAAAR